MGRQDSMTIVEFPFGKGSLTTNGIQYVEVTGKTHAALNEVETATLVQPQITGYSLVEIQCSLTGATKSSSTVKDVTYKWQISDDNSTWVDLNSLGTHSANASSYVDVTYSGTFAPTGNFEGNKGVIYIRFVIQAEHGDETASGKTKNSSWVKRTYRNFTAGDS